ncbi:proton-conducting transporter membrane subunit [Pseudonocardia eucalypti]|uniref:Proton-conducting transporter membrane subunit n=1 Tax=Pseudonocardia eucalypti TaxID=648755 RepID=A0ABP9PPP8_9PSEU|nr:hydrogenase-4 component F [Pseudonocardia eucalypti]
MNTLVPLLIWAPVLLPLLGAAGYALWGWRPSTRWLAASCSALLLCAAVALAALVARTGPHTAAGGVLRVDALSAYMLVVIGTIALLATAATPAYLAAEITAERATPRAAALHSVLVALFIAAMAAALLAADLGLLWVAVEATTICTAFLVGQRRTRAAVEAAWKYVVICSTGIALALLGAFLLNHAATHAGRPGLNLRNLNDIATGLDPGVTRIAIALLILGFGTKVGLAPLHAWLPDAHSQAPAPVSALMSGVLLSVAFYAILRVKHLADAALGPGFARTLLLVMSLATLAVAATLLLAQRDYKRMLAYSSMEHMGLLALAAAVGTRLAVAALLLHMLGHGLAKAVLFVGSGRILQLTGTSQIHQVRGLAARDPVLAGCVGLGVLALLGFPPFSLFASELGMFRAGFAAGPGWLIAAALLLVLVVTAALLAHCAHMLLGNPAHQPTKTAADTRDTTTGANDTGATVISATATSASTTSATGGTSATAVAVPPGERSPSGTIAVLAAGLIACAVLGITTGALQQLLYQAADTITSTP